MYEVDQFEDRGIVVKVFQDDDSSPREWSNLGTMVCFHRSYALGDEKHGFSNAEELLAHVAKTKAIVLPVYLMDHSGLALSTSDFSGFDPQGWDSGQVGMIFVERAKVLKEYSVKTVTASVKASVIRCLKGEVEAMHQYVSGEVYGVVLKRNGRELDSLWGMFGIEYTREEAKRMVDDALEMVKADDLERERAACEGVATEGEL